MKKIFFVLIVLIVGSTSIFSQDKKGDVIKFTEGDNIVITEIEVSSWDFSPSEIMLKSTDNNRLVFTITSGRHGVAIPKLKLKSDTLEVGESVTFDLTDLKKGEYKFFCNVYCGSGHKKMKGVIIVE